MSYVVCSCSGSVVVVVVVGKAACSCRGREEAGHLLYCTVLYYTSREAISETIGTWLE